MLLVATFIVELGAELAIAAKVDFTWMYHLFVVVEYSLISWYFSNIVDKKFRKVILGSIPFFVLVSLSISYWMYGFRSFPGMNINTEGILVSIISSYTLLNLPDATKYNRMVQHPDFWICFGWMAFFTGTFLLHGLYSYLHGLDRMQALELFTWINRPLNIVLYSCLITGFLCVILRKSTLRSF